MALTYYAQVKRAGVELFIASPSVKVPAELCLKPLPKAA